MIHLHIISGSARPQRAGLAVARWLADTARKDGRFSVRLIDLGEVALPILNEPAHPRLKQYQHQHTKDWSETIEKGDAFIFVTPEYNYSIPASLKNALDYLFVEWKMKPAAIASYGGISGGLRAAQHLKHVLGALDMQLVNEAVVAPFFAKQIDDNTFQPSDIQTQSATAMFSALEARYALLNK